MPELSGAGHGNLATGDVGLRQPWSTWWLQCLPLPLILALLPLVALSGSSSREKKDQALQSLGSTQPTVAQGKSCQLARHYLCSEGPSPFFSTSHTWQSKRILPHPFPYKCMELGTSYPATVQPQSAGKQEAQGEFPPPACCYLGDPSCLWLGRVSPAPCTWGWKDQLAAPAGQNK